MRDRRFVGIHRGGPLSKEHHRQLMGWAHGCAKHVFRLLKDQTIDVRLYDGLIVAKAWEKGKVPVGAAQKASVAAHAVARDSPNPVAVAVARSVGQAVATAHMADHSLGAAYYALKAVKAAGKSVGAERDWQNKHIPAEVKELVISALEQRFAKKE